MVAVVGGSGSGLVNTSKEVAGSAGQVGQAGVGSGGEAVTVNASNGNLVVQHRDEYVVGVGADIDLLRTYNSQGVWDGDNADGWRMAYYRRVSLATGVLNQAGSTVVRIEADGFESKYTFDGTRYVSTDGAGAYDTLTIDAATKTARWVDGDTGVSETYTQEATGGNYRLSQVSDPEGHQVRVGYDAGSGLIKNLSSWKAGATAADETVDLVYDAATQRLNQLVTHHWDADGKAVTRSVVSYTYQADGKLKTVTTDLSPEDNATADGKTYVVGYGYDGAGRLNHIEQTDGSVLDIVYDASGRVGTVTDALQRVSTFTYDTAARKTTVTDALQQTTVLGYDADGRLTDIAGAAEGGAAFKESFGYNGKGDLLTHQNAQGEVTTYAYNANGARTRSTDAAGNVHEYGYDSANRLTSDVAYTVPDPDGPAQSGLPGNPLTTQYLYDSGSGNLRRLRFVLSPEGRVTQYDYNGLGQRTASTQYANVAYTGTPTLAALSAWASGLSLADKAAVQRTAYSYDLRGQLRSTSVYGSATVSGNDIVFGAEVKETRIYDAFGRLLQTIDGKNNATAYAYDGLNRRTLSTDANHIQAVTSYDDKGRQTTVKLSNGLNTVSTYDAMGQRVSVSQLKDQAVLGQTLYVYDPLGRPVMSQDPTGLKTWKLYDPAGRLSGEVSAAGRLSEFIYDAAGRLVQTVQYAKPLSATVLAGLVDANGQPVAKKLADLRPQADAQDRIDTRFYDKAGRLVGVQDAEGAVTTTRYDGASRAVSTLAYAKSTAITRIAVGADATVANAPLLSGLTLTEDAANDRRTRAIYGNDGLLLGSLDAEGHLTEMHYDSAGRLTEKIAYSTPSDPAVWWTAGSLAALTPKAQPQDRRSVWLYDTAGRVSAEIDPEGHLTEHVYDDAGRRQQSIRYATAVTAAVSAQSPLLSIRPASSNRDHSTRWDYDALGRVWKETASDGTVTQSTYDDVGHLIRTDTALGQPEVRTLSTRYDVQGRVIAQLSAEGASRLTGSLTQAQIDALWTQYGSKLSYDKSGRLTQRTDALGNATVYYYDTEGRQVLSVLKTPDGGEVQQTGYNTFGDANSRVVYAKRLVAADANALTGGLIDAALSAKVTALSDPARDLKTRTEYNRRSQIQKAIDGLNGSVDSEYNAFGQLNKTTADVDKTRRVQTELGYDRRGLLTSTRQDASGINALTTSEYDAFGRVVARVDARKQRQTLDHLKDDGQPDGGRKVVVTDASGTHTTVYDAFEQVVQQTDGLGNTVRTQYDPVKRTTTTTTAEGIVTESEYNRFGQIIRVTDGSKAATTYSYDHDGNLLTTTDALGNVTQNTYDAADNLRTVTVGLKANPGAAPSNDGSASLTQYTYDAARRVLTRAVDPAGLNLTTRHTYDGRGLEVQTTDAAGVVTRQNFDAQGQLQSTVVDDTEAGLQLKTAYTYDAQGRRLTVVEGDGTPEAKTTEYRYDLLGRRTDEIVDPAGLKLATQYKYDTAGNVVLKLDDNLSRPTRYVYDALGRLKYTIDATKGVSRRQYDAEGRLLNTRAYAKALSKADITLALTDADIEAEVAQLESAADEVVQYAYDKDGRQTHVINAEGAVTQSRYDAAGRVVETIRYATRQPGVWGAGSVPKADATRDQSTRFVYDKAGRLRFTVDPLNFVTSQAYDRQGRVTVLRRYATAIARPAAMDEAGVTTAITNNKDKPEAVNDRTDYKVYDAAGRLRYEVDAAGYVTGRTYDALGRVKATWRSNSAASFASLPTLAQAGAYMSTKTFDGSAAGVTGDAHVYDNNRLKLVNKPVAGGTWAGTRSTSTLALGSAVQFDITPNALQPGLYAGIDSVAPSSYARFVALFKDDGKVSVQVFNADKWAAEVQLGAYTPGVTYRVEIGTDSAGGARLYIYEAAKSRESGYSYATDAPLSWSSFSTIFYTDLHDYQKVETTAYVDNLIEQTALKLSEDSYDAAGRRLTSTDAAGVVTRYGYDATGRLKTETRAAGRKEETVTEHRYDKAGRRVQQTEALGTPEAAVTRYQYDAQGRLAATIEPRGVALAESDGTWAVSERQEQGKAAQAASLSAADKKAYLDKYSTRYTYDAAGRRNGTTDALGTVTTTRYDALGRAVSQKVQSGSTATTTYRYYDQLDREIQRVDAEGYLDENRYDAFGNLTDHVRHDTRVAGTLAEQSATLTSIAVVGTAPASGTAPYVVSNASFDATTHSEYNRRNERLSQTDPENNFEGTREALDAFGQKRSVENKLKGTATYTYDRLGRQISETLPVNGRNAAGQSVPVVNKNVYDSRGNRIQTLEAVGLPEQRTTTYQFDALDRLVRKIGMDYVADDGKTVTPVDSTQYDALGNTVEQITNGKLVNNAVVGGKRSVAYYDKRQQKIAEVSADQVLARYTYDPAGHLVVHKILAQRLASAPVVGVLPDVAAPNAEDRTLRYSYDALGRKTQTRLDGLISWSAGNTLLTLAAVDKLAKAAEGPQTVAIETLSYDAWDHVTQRKDAQGNVSYERYDGIGRKLLSVDADNAVIGWDYEHAFSTATREVRYAGRLPAAPTAQQTPLAVRQAASAATSALASQEASRITTYVLDRLGRVTQQSVAGVQSETVQDDGTRVQRTTEAQTQYVYDGLGHVKQTIQRAAQLADGSNVLEVTDIAYDALGRETSRQAPGFVDFEGKTVRPRNDTVYDGVGNVTRRIQRGKDDAVETDDRITQYAYDGNGRLTSETGAALGGTDAALALTTYAYNDSGDIVRRTLVDVRRADGSKRSLVTQYERDASGRITLERDLDTGTVKNTRYNAFGEVEAKGTNGDWQEFASYTTLGKVWKSNSGDGAYKLYLQDKNGNTTREMRSVGQTSLKDIGLVEASQREDLRHTYSVYDKRNQLKQTAEPKLLLWGSQVDDLQQQFTEKWVPQLGDVEVDDSEGGSYQGGTVTAGGTLGTVGGEGSQTALPQTLPQVSQPAVSLGAGTPAALGPATAEVLAWPSQVSWSFDEITARDRDLVQASFVIPADWPDGEYSVYEDVGGGVNLIASAAHIKDSVKFGWFNAGDAKIRILYKAAAGAGQLLVEEFSYTKVTQWNNAESDRGIDWYDISYVKGVSSVQSTSKLTFDRSTWGTGVASFTAVLDPDTAGARPLTLVNEPDNLPGDPKPIALTQSLTLPAEALAAGHVVRVLGFDAEGHVVAGKDLLINGPMLAGLTQREVGKGLEGTVWMDSATQMRLDLGPGTGTSGTIHVRAKGQWMEWKSVAYSNSVVDPAALNLFNGAECEFVVEPASGSMAYGTLTFSGGTPSLPTRALRSFTHVSEPITIDVPAGTHKVDFYINGALFTAQVPAGGNRAVFEDADAMRNVVLLGLWRTGTAKWRYVATDAASQVTATAHGDMPIGLPADLDISAPGITFTTEGPPEYRPEAILNVGTVPGQFTIGSTGTVIRTEADNPQLQRKTDPVSGLPYYVVDLQAFKPADGEQNVSVQFDGDNGLRASVTFAVSQDGSAKRVGEVSYQFLYSPKMVLSVPNAKKISAFSINGVPLTESELTARISVNENVFTWDTTGVTGTIDAAGNKTVNFEFTGVDDAGQVVNRGSGSVTIGTDGHVISSTPPTPSFVRPLLNISAPAGTESLTVTLTDAAGHATPLVLTNPTDRADGKGRTFTADLTALRPAADTATYRLSFEGRDANGQVTTRGKDGSLTIDKVGATTTTAPVERVAVPINFKLVGRDNVAQVGLKLTNLAEPFNTIEVTPSSIRLEWVPPKTMADGSPGELGYMRVSWDAAVSQVPKGSYKYELIPQDAQGQPLQNELGAELKQTGRLILDPNSAQPAQLLQSVKVLNPDKAVMVSRQQSYNAFGEVIEERDDRVADRAEAMLGRKLTAAEEAAARTTLSYNTLGQLVKKTDPQTDITLNNGYRYRDRPVTSFGYDLLGRLVSTTDANGNVSLQQVRAGSTAQQPSATAEYVGPLNEGGKRSTAYDIFGDARRITDQEGHVIRQSFDAMSRLTRVDRDGVKRMDASGVEGAAFTLSSEYSYDQLGQRILQRDGLRSDVAAGAPDLSVTLKTAYDGLGRVVSTTDGLGLETRYSYQNLGATSSDTVLGAGTGGLKLGGTQRTTTQADGRTLIDKTDAFGHVRWHQDLSGAAFNYTYNAAGQLTRQTGAVHSGTSAGQDIEYTYYANGYLAKATDHTQGTLSQYGYDDAGNRTEESYFQLIQGTNEKGEVVETPSVAYQSAKISYDELNRMVRVSDPHYVDIRYEYDAVGNRRMVDSVYWDGAAGLRNRQTYWYDYDTLNRFTVTKGSLGERATSKTGAAKVEAGTEGTRLSYDRLGQRTQAVYTFNGEQITESYGYSQDGFLQSTWQQKKAADGTTNSQLASVRVLDTRGRTVEYHDKAGNSVMKSTYDADNRLLQQDYSSGAQPESSGVTTYAYFDAVAADGKDSTSSQRGAGQLASMSFKPTSGNAGTTTTSYTYSYWDDARRATITKTSSNQSEGGKTTLTYNANGHLQSTRDEAAKVTTSYFNNANGLILKRERKVDGHDKVGSHYFYYADGKRVGDVGDDPGDNTRVSYAEQLAAKQQPAQDRLAYYKNFKPVGSADFDQNFEPINENYPSAVPGNYTVRGGENMKAIAQALWGDASMWYLIAEANGLRGDETLQSGQVLTIPNKVTNIHNNSQTFRPYSAGEAIGHIDPSLPPPPPPPSKGGGCGGIGAIVATVVIVVAAVYTGGAALEFLGPALSAYGTAGAVAAGALSAAAGSIVSQGVGMAIGAQDSFSWKAVGQAALGGGVAGGVAQFAKAGGALQSIGGPGEWHAAGRSALSSAATQALRGNWNWQEVMAAGVGGGVGAAVGNGLANSDFGRSMANATSVSTASFGVRMAAGLAGGITGQWAGPGGKARYNSAFASTLGSILGSDLAQPTQGQGPWSAMDYRNGSDIESDGPAPMAAQLQAMQAGLGPVSESAGRQWAAVQEANNWRFADDAAQRSEQNLQSVLGGNSSGLAGNNVMGLLNDVGQVSLPGSYGGDYTSVRWIGQDHWEGQNLILQGMELTHHRGALGRADSALQSMQDQIEAQVQHVQDMGAEAYAQGHHLTAALAAVRYLPDRVVGDVMKGAVGLLRLPTSDTMFPGLVNAASHPIDTAQSAYGAMRGMSMQEGVIAGVELLGPGALKLGSPAMTKLNSMAVLGADLRGVATRGLDNLAAPRTLNSQFGGVVFGNAALNPAAEVKLGLKTLDPTTVSFTQSSVSYGKAGASYNLDTLVQSMSADGWVGKPIDVVAMPDGTLASIDNTRVLAARQAGIDVEANVRGFDEAITDPARQLSLTEKGNVPDTWGDAALLRINKPIQNASYPGMNPGWSVRFPYGSIYDPVVKY